MEALGNRMKDKVYGSLYGVILGDALGMPVETLTQGDIRKRIGPSGVTGFMDPMQTRIDDTKHMLAGDSTDDWQLAKVVLTSLITAEGWDQDHIIEAHVVALRESTFGWGKGSVSAIHAIISGERDGKSPPPKVPGVGLGNGVMMKVAPLALYHALQNLDRSARLVDFDWKTFGGHVRELGVITHSDARAWISAFAAGMVIIGCMYGVPEEHKSFWMNRIADMVQQFESFCVPNPTERVLAGKVREAGVVYPHADIVLEKFGSRFTVLETLPFTIATFMRHSTDFRSGVLEAVNAGGDTDTNASIVGAMIGANVGAKNIPEEWRSFRAEYSELIILGDQLLELVS